MVGHTAFSYNPYGGEKEKNSSPVSHIISQIPYPQDINSPEFLTSACMGAQACTLASHVSAAVG